MVPQAGLEHKELRERDKMAPEMEPETKKPGKKSMRLQKSFYLSLIVCLRKL